MSMTPEKATALRKPFPPESVGKLPKGGMMLDYVGHAAVTDRLLTVDPEWSWEPFALGPDGLPAPDREGNLWIRLTICGVTRIGVGDGKNAKERIGDAIRNAAMRFGVALDLWAKENLVEFAQAAQAPRPKSTPAVKQRDFPESAPPAAEAVSDITDAQVKKLNILLREHGMDTDEARYAWLSQGCAREITSSKQLTKAEATRAIDALTRKATSRAVEPSASEADLHDTEGDHA